MSNTLHGPRLVLAWALFLGAVGATLFVFFGSLPTYFALLQTVCTSARCIVGQPARDTVLTLQNLGLSVETYAQLAVAFNVGTETLACAIGALLVWRKPNDRMVLLVALMLVMVSSTITMYSLLQQPSAWQTPALLLNLLSFAALFFVTPMMPDGRFVPGWARWLGPAWLVWNVLALGILKQSYPGIMTNGVWLVAIASLAVALVVRYRSISDPIARQQLKWVVFGWAGALIISVIVNLPEPLAQSGGQPGSHYDLIRTLINSLVLVPSILSIWVATSRYRLWDIDVLVNRALVYGTLTVLLALLYLGSVVLLQEVFAPFTGTSDIAIVGSTLAIATLFSPLRQYTQAAIDRRFYRRKYDAAKTLAHFGERIRDEVELSRLSAELLAVVEETVRPEHVALWLREPAEPHRRRGGAKRARGL